MRQELDFASRAGDSGLLRRLNLSAALQAFLAAESLTVRELRRTIGVSRPTAEEVLDTLISRGQLEELSAVDLPTSGTAGRPARRYRLTATSGYVAGIDIGAHKVACAIADLRGTVVAKRRRRVDPDLSAAARLGVADRVLGEACTAAGIDRAQLNRVACGITGSFILGDKVLDLQRAEAGIELRPYSLPGFAEIDIPAALSERLRCEVLIANDVTLAALAEHWQGAAIGVDDVVFIFAGRRFGAGVLINGKVHQGRHGLAGQVGTLPMLGWAETMEHLAAEAAAAASTSATKSSDDDVARLFGRAAEGDKAALKTVDRVARALALGAATLVHAVDPELVVLGGGLSSAGDVLAVPFRKHLNDMCLVPRPVVLSHLSDESVALGAIRFALDEVQHRMLAVESA